MASLKNVLAHSAALIVGSSLVLVPISGQASGFSAGALADSVVGLAPNVALSQDQIIQRGFGQARIGSDADDQIGLRANLVDSLVPVAGRAGALERAEQALSGQALNDQTPQTLSAGSLDTGVALAQSSSADGSNQSESLQDELMMIAQLATQLSQRLASLEQQQQQIATQAESAINELAQRQQRLESNQEELAQGQQSLTEQTASEFRAAARAIENSNSMAEAKALEAARIVAQQVNQQQTSSAQTQVAQSQANQSQAQAAAPASTSATQETVAQETATQETATAEAEAEAPVTMASMAPSNTITDPTINANLAVVPHKQTAKIFGDAEADLIIGYNHPDGPLIAGLDYQGGEVETEKYVVNHGVTIQGLSRDPAEALLPIDDFRVAPTFSVARKLSDTTRLVVDGKADLSTSFGSVEGGVGYQYEEDDTLAGLRVFGRTEAVFDDTSDTGRSSLLTAGAEAFFESYGIDIAGFETDVTARATVERNENGEVSYDLGAQAIVDLAEEIDLPGWVAKKTAKHALSNSAHMEPDNLRDFAGRDHDLPDGQSLRSLRNLLHEVERRGMTTQSQARLELATSDVGVGDISADVNLAKALSSKLVTNARFGYRGQYVPGALLGQEEASLFSRLQGQVELAWQATDQVTISSQATAQLDAEFALTQLEADLEAAYHLTDRLSLGAAYAYQDSGINTDTRTQNHLLGGSLRYTSSQGGTAFASIDRAFDQDLTPGLYQARIGVEGEFDSFLSKDRSVTVSAGAAYQFGPNADLSNEATGFINAVIPLN